MDTKLTENRCAHLLKDVALESESGLEALEKMFDLQKKLQLRIGHDYDTMPFHERVKWLQSHWTSMTSEFGEVLERLPWKHWKKYSPEQLSGFTTEEQKIESLYELVDMFHFFLNMCLCLGMDAKTFWSLYVTKNQENIRRQNSGY